MRIPIPRTVLALLAVFGLVASMLAPVTLYAQESATPQASPVAESEANGPVDLDVLFIGAHPDDEAFGLAAYGQWNEFADVNMGVITVTRGEGGGNAIGPEEGPALGLIREAEERTAVGYAGIEHVYYMDKVDFYYTVSAPLTIQTWDYEDTLERVVRVVRTTRPEVIITMNPSPTPGNHGHHQVAARLAIDAFYAAADPERFPDQITDEGLEAWSAASIWQSPFLFAAPGPDCATSYHPSDPTEVTFGVWQGTISEANGGRNWGEIARDGQRAYASQGWAGFPDAPTDPAEIPCNFFTLIDSRVPISPYKASTTAVLENAVLPEPGGLPLGTQLSLTASQFNVLAGEAFTVTASATAAEGEDISAGTFMLAVPDGWTSEAAGDPVADGASLAQEFTITPAADAAANTKYRIGGTLNANGVIGGTVEAVNVAPAVSGVLAPRPEIAQFLDWAVASNVPQLTGLIGAWDAIAVGETRDLDVLVTNNSAEAQSGSVSIDLPGGFTAAESSQSYDGLAAGESTTVSFSVTNTDTSLPTSNEGGEDGTYWFTVTTDSSAGSSTNQAGLNLVPAALVGPASPDLAIDGVISDGEYAGDGIDVSRVWEGDPPDSPEDASGTAWLAWDENGLYVAVEVHDDILGTVLTPEDAKRHWRTDSVEIAIDPLGTASNTSATFKVGVFPTSTDGQPQAYRDADAHQGPVAETAPGFEVASTLSDPYSGYVLETFIPFDALPAEFDPNQAALNIFIYDSDTQDLTGQTRLGWSTWGGVQGDPYRWGQITLVDELPVVSASPEAVGATPVASPVAVAATEDVVVSEDIDAPIMPLDVAQSTRSPQSIAQSAWDGVGLGGRASVAEGEGLTFQGTPAISDGQLEISWASGSENGTMVVFVVDADGNILLQEEKEIEANNWYGASYGTVPETDEATLLVSFETESGRVQAFSFPLTAGG